MPIIFKVKHYLCALFYLKMKNMKNFRFIQMEIATTFWVAIDTHLYVEDYSAKLQAYYVFWFNAYGKQHRWLGIEDMKVILHCIFGYFGRDSHSFKEWRSLIKLVKKSQPDEILNRFTY